MEAYLDWQPSIVTKLSTVPNGYSQVNVKAMMERDDGLTHVLKLLHSPVCAVELADDKLLSSPS